MDEQRKKEKEIFLKAIDNYYNKKLDMNEFIPVGKTPEYLQKLGVENLDVVVKQSTIKKCIREPKGSISAHSLSRAMIESIPEQLYNPVFVVDETKRNSYALISDSLDQNGYPMLMAISLQKTILGVEVNEISSFYGRNNLEFYLKERHTVDEVYICDKEKAKMLSRFLRLQLPTAWKVLDHTDICENIVSQPTENVNKKMLDDLKKNNFQPTSSLVNYMKELHKITGRELSIADVSNMYSGIKNPEIQDIVKSIAEECAQQEKARKVPTLNE